MDRPSSLRPVVQALLLADHVYRDQATGKFVIAGTFRQVWAETFPTQYAHPAYAFLSLTNLRGRTELRLRFLDLENLAVLLQTPAIAVECNDPLATMELACGVGPLPLPHPGVYALELVVDEQVIGSLRVAATPIPRPAPPPAT